MRQVERNIPGGATPVPLALAPGADGIASHIVQCLTHIKETLGEGQQLDWALLLQMCSPDFNWDAVSKPSYATLKNLFLDPKSSHYREMPGVHSYHNSILRHVLRRTLLSCVVQKMKEQDIIFVPEHIAVNQLLQALLAEDQQLRQGISFFKKTHTVGIVGGAIGGVVALMLAFTVLGLLKILYQQRDQMDVVKVTAAIVMCLFVLKMSNLILSDSIDEVRQSLPKEMRMFLGGDYLTPFAPYQQRIERLMPVEAKELHHRHLEGAAP